MSDNQDAIDAFTATVNGAVEKLTEAFAADDATLAAATETLDFTKAAQAVQDLTALADARTPVPEPEPENPPEEPGTV